MNLINASKFIHCDPNELVRVTNSVNRLMAESNDFDYIESVITNSFSGDLLEYAIDIISEKKSEKKSEKIKGVDGKACWKGYRYAGTENGKDKCIKSESVLVEEKSSYMGVEIVFNGRSFSAPSLAIYNVASKPQIKIRIKEKILKRNELQSKMKNPPNRKVKAEEFVSELMDIINEVHVYSLQENLVETNEEFFQILNLMSEDELISIHEKIKNDKDDADDKPASKYTQPIVGKKKGSVIIHPRIKSTTNVYESLINEVDLSDRSPDCGNEIVTCDNKKTKKPTKKTLFKKDKSMNNESAVYEEFDVEELAEIVTEHLLDQGLNEYGIDNLIEEMGVEEFCDYIDSLVEEEDLLEWRRGPGGSKVRGSGTAKSGKAIFQLKGGAKSAAIRATPEHKARKAERENEGSSHSKMKDALRSQSKIAKAKVSQPETKSTPVQTKEKAKGGVLGAIKARAQRDTALLRKSVDTARNVGARRAAEVKATYDAIRNRGKEVETRSDVVRARRKATVAAGRAAQAAGRTAVKAAGAAGAAAGEAVKARRSGKSGAATAGRAVGTFIRKMRSEDFELLSNYLMDKYNLTESAAFDLIESYDDSTLEYMFERASITYDLNESFSNLMESKKKNN